MRIMILGTGYVGLVNGICFAEFGFDVVCVDIDNIKIEKLQRGELPIYEPELQALLQKNIKFNRIRFTTSIVYDIEYMDLIILTIGTPNIANTGEVDLSFLLEAVHTMAPYLSKYTPIIIKSTVLPGTCRALKNEILLKNPQANFDLIANPEFLREGSAINDFLCPDRIVIGLDNSTNREIMTKLYGHLCDQQIPIVFTTLETAELIKYSSNAFLATKIAFINEMADICEKISADVQVVAYAMGLDSRIGEKFLQVGPGFGGSCFPKDILALDVFSRDLLVPSSITAAVISSNISRKNTLIDKVKSACNGSVKGKEVAVLGLAFKPNTDDIRESPALKLISDLLVEGAFVRIYDPVAMENTKSYIKRSDTLKYVNSYKECINMANVLILATEWNEFKSLNLHEINKLLHALDKHNPAVFIDLKNIYDPADFIGLNMKYVSIGRATLCVN